MMNQLRQRVFGGKAGILLCRKQTAAPPVRITTTLKWDDERGRPIYDMTSTTTATSISYHDERELSSPALFELETTIREDDDDHVNNNDDNDESRPPVPKTTSQQQPVGNNNNKSIASSSSSVSYPFHVMVNPTQKRSRRAAFGARKAARLVDPDELLFSNTTVMALLPLRPPISTGRRTTTAALSVTTTTSTVQQQQQQSTPQDSSIGSSSSSSNDGEELLPLDPETTVAANSEERNATSTTTAAAGRMPHIPVSEEKSEFDFDDHDDDDDDDHAAVGRCTTGTVHHQPCANTSLSAAKAYFAHLDATGSPLVQQQHVKNNNNNNRYTSSSSSPDGVHHRVVRTRRRLQINNPTVVAEYHAYQNACHQAGVLPMSMEAYVKERSRFFADQHRLYDGFLDE